MELGATQRLIISAENAFSYERSKGRDYAKRWEKRFYDSVEPLLFRSAYGHVRIDAIA